MRAKIAATCAGVLLGGKDHFGHPGAQRAVMIDLGKAQVLEGQMCAAAPAPRPRRCGPRALRSTALQCATRSISALPSSGACFAPPNARIASCITCFSGTPCSRAILRQTSYSGDAFATSPDGQRAILIRTLPHSRFHFRKLPRQRQLVFQPPAQSDGRRLAQQQVAQRRHLLRARKHRHLHARAALLHLHRAHGKHPTRPPPAATRSRRPALRRRVVDHRLDHRDRLGSSCFVRRLAHQQPQQVRLARRVAPTGSVAARLDAHRRQRTVSNIQHPQQPPRRSASRAPSAARRRTPAHRPAAPASPARAQAACRARTSPCRFPRSSGEAIQRSTPSASHPAAAHTISTIVSTAPTSWKCTFSMGIEWIAASASPSNWNARVARCFTASLSGAA